MLRHIYEKFGIDPNRITCTDCLAKHECYCAYDPYNTDGDCLMK